MASTNDHRLRPESPFDDASPTSAIGTYPGLGRCVSTASSFGSSADATSRDSLGSTSDVSSRQSSGSYSGGRRSDGPSFARQSSQGPEATRHRRRGYMRPQGTDFAASAKSRESVMSLGSIAHLQYYFARTGLLDGKGGQLARKKQNQRGTLDLSSFDSTGLDGESSYASLRASPDPMDQGYFNGTLPEHGDEFDESFGDGDPDMLPPTVSTYNHKEKVVPKPPTIQELKADLEQTLQESSKALKEVRERKQGVYKEPPDVPQLPNMPEENTQGWYELQGMHILDVSTLAIRAAKMYYTAHELPERLDAIKPEKQVRADLLAVMEVLKQMATRNFKGGMKDDEVDVIDGWVDSVFDILRREQEIASAEHTEHASWAWLRGDWTGRELEREHAFLTSMDPDPEPLPAWTPAADAPSLPTPFFAALQNGVRLIKLHNAILKRSRRRYGAIPTFHTDTQKPYRCADNLRYWVKAAELRFEVALSVDALGMVYNNDRQVWLDFEAALLKWCRRVREELEGEL